MPPNRLTVARASGARAFLVALLTAAGCLPFAAQSQATPVAPDSGEAHLANTRQLTHGGTSAEAYWSRDGRWLIFQSTLDGRACDQEYVMRVDGSDLKKVSNGKGKTTCGWFYDRDRKIFFSSSDAADSVCPQRPDPSKGYVWGLDQYDIYTATPDGSDRKRLTNYGVYTAEGTLSPDGQRIVFTSLKDGDLEIYTMKVDGSDVRRLTHVEGYDGGPVYSPDGKKIVYRAYHPTDSAELADYRGLLAQHIVRPTKMEIWVMNADGSDQHQITHLGGANFAPAFTPDGKRIIFSSNYKHPRGPGARNFDLYLIDVDGSHLEQVTTDPEFDGFPMFSPDGKYLVWESGRHVPPGELDVFVAEWKP